MIEEKERKKLLKLARDSIYSNFSDVKVDESLKEEFSYKAGAFVTLHEDGELRGCIGFIEAAYPLYDTIMHAAKAAAFEDPRFMPLAENELSKIKIEISVLTSPKLIEVKDSSEYLKKIKIGTHGLIIKSSYRSGLLLPQVAPEWKWDVLEFLEHTCQKAGLAKDAWKDLRNKIYSFECEVFSE